MQYTHDDVRIHARMDDTPAPTQEEMAAMYAEAMRSV